MGSLEPLDPETTGKEEPPPQEVSSETEEAARRLAQTISELAQTDQHIIGLRDVEELSVRRDSCAARRRDRRGLPQTSDSRAITRLKQLASGRPALARYLEGGQ